MGLGGSITPNVQQSATDAETLGERDDVFAGIHSLDGVATKFVALPAVAFFRSTLRLLSRKVCNIKLSRSRGSSQSLETNQECLSWITRGAKEELTFMPTAFGAKAKLPDARTLSCFLVTERPSPGR